METIIISKYDNEFKLKVANTHSILQSGNLVIHPAVNQITLHGSRGLAGNPRPNSDIDLSLLVPLPFPYKIDDDLEDLMRDVLKVTLSNWKSPMELDLAAIFPIHSCRFECFQVNYYDPFLCPKGGVDCFGIYKIQKGFAGFVFNAGIQVKKMYPIITIWKKSLHQTS